MAEGTLEVGPQKDYLVFLDGEHLGSLLMLVGNDLREISRTLGVSVRSVYGCKDFEEHPPRPAYLEWLAMLDPVLADAHRLTPRVCRRDGAEPRRRRARWVAGTSRSIRSPPR